MYKLKTYVLSKLYNKPRIFYITGEFSCKFVEKICKKNFFLPFFLRILIGRYLFRG